MDTAPPQARAIVRYANRKMYDAAAGEHVTADTLLGHIAAGTPFAITSCTDGRDYTQVVLCSVLARISRRPGAQLDTDCVIKAIQSYTQVPMNEPVHV